MKNIDEQLIKIEDKNLKIVQELENKNEDLNTKNIELKYRIAKFNISEFTNKFNVQNVNRKKFNVTNVTNLNVTDKDKITHQELHEKNVITFNCYKCQQTFTTLNTLMNHKRKHHKITKCKNMDKCRYIDNCWFSHDSESEDSESIITHYTT